MSKNTKTNAHQECKQAAKNCVTQMSKMISHKNIGLFLSEFPIYYPTYVL